MDRGEVVIWRGCSKCPDLPGNANRMRDALLAYTQILYGYNKPRVHGRDIKALYDILDYGMDPSKVPKWMEPGDGGE